MLVGFFSHLLSGLFVGTPAMVETAPLTRHIKRYMIATLPAPLQEFRGLPKSVQNSETVSGVSKQFLLTLWRLFQDSSRDFSDPGPEVFGRFFGDSFGISGPEGPGDSCKGEPALQVYTIFCCAMHSAINILGYF